MKNTLTLNRSVFLQTVTWSVKCEYHGLTKKRNNTLLRTMHNQIRLSVFQSGFFIVANSLSIKV